MENWTDQSEAKLRNLSNQPNTCALAEYNVHAVVLMKVDKLKVCFYNKCDWFGPIALCAYASRENPFSFDIILHLKWNKV